MPPGPLVQATVVATVKAKLLAMQFEVTDTSGNPATVNQVDCRVIDLLSAAIGEEIFDFLTQQVLTAVEVILKQENLQGGNAGGAVLFTIPAPVVGTKLQGTGTVQ